MMAPSSFLTTKGVPVGSIEPQRMNQGAEGTRLHFSALRWNQNDRYPPELEALSKSYHRSGGRLRKRYFSPGLATTPVDVHCERAGTTTKISPPGGSFFGTSRRPEKCVTPHVEHPDIETTITNAVRYGATRLQIMEWLGLVPSPICKSDPPI